MTIEGIVDNEFEAALNRIQAWPDLCVLVRAVQLEEREHKASGEIFSAGRVDEATFIGKIARAAAYTAKYAAERF